MFLLTYCGVSGKKDQFFESTIFPWKHHIKYTENKISKNIRKLYKARDFLIK